MNNKSRTFPKMPKNGGNNPEISRKIQKNGGNQGSIPKNPEISGKIGGKLAEMKRRVAKNQTIGVNGSRPTRKEVEPEVVL